MEEFRKSNSRRVFKLSGLIVLGLLIYLLSYAPYLRIVGSFGSAYHRGPYYRSPAVFRPVEWLMWKGADSEFVWIWADCFEVRDATELQVFYYAQDLEDLSGFHFNIQE